MKKKEKKLHGNRAKIDPDTKLQSAFTASMITQSSKRRPDTNTAIIPDEQVEYARNFVNENQK